MIYVNIMKVDVKLTTMIQCCHEEQCNAEINYTAKMLGCKRPNTFDGFFCCCYGSSELSDSGEYSLLIIGFHRLNFCHHAFNLQPEFLQE